MTVISRSIFLKNWPRNDSFLLRLNAASPTVLRLLTLLNIAPLAKPVADTLHINGSKQEALRLSDFLKSSL